jgi:hypothetical protein
LSSLVGKDTCFSFNITFQLNLQGRSGNYGCPGYHGYEVPCLQGGSSHKGEEMFAFLVIFSRIFVHSQSGGHLEEDAKKTKPERTLVKNSRKYGRKIISCNILVVG